MALPLRVKILLRRTWQRGDDENVMVLVESE